MVEAGLVVILNISGIRVQGQLQQLWASICRKIKFL
jgi:hypothetical protein